VHVRLVDGERRPGITTNDKNNGTQKHKQTYHAATKQPTKVTTTFSDII
jgi:hypothetical protein